MGDALSRIALLVQILLLSAVTHHAGVRVICLLVCRLRLRDFATDFRFGLEALTAARFVLAAELFFALAGLVLATFFFAALLLVVCFRFVPAFLAFTVFFVEERLTAFYAQKAELRLRLRELKVQSAQRALDVELAKAEEIRLIREGEVINKSELRLRLRELRVYRKAMAEVVPAVTPREKPVAPREAIQVPLIFAPPASPQ